MTPTKTQYEELINNTTPEWTPVNGVNVYKFTNKADSSKYIFLPAAGWWYITVNGDSVHGNIGEYGHYWSATLNTSNTPYAWYTEFGPDRLHLTWYARYHGHSIRGIQ